MKIKILSKNEWQSYPITDDMIDVSEEDLQLVSDGFYEFDNGKVIPIKSNEYNIDDSTDLSYLYEKEPVRTPVNTSLPY